MNVLALLDCKLTNDYDGKCYVMYILSGLNILLKGPNSCTLERDDITTKGTKVDLEGER